MSSGLQNGQITDTGLVTKGRPAQEAMLDPVSSCEFSQGFLDNFGTIAQCAVVRRLDAIAVSVSSRGGDYSAVARVSVRSVPTSAADKKTYPAVRLETYC